MWPYCTLSLKHWVSTTPYSLVQQLIIHCFIFSSLYAGEIPALTTADGTVSWKPIHKDREFSGYAVMSLSPDHQWLAVGSLQGCITLLLLEKTNGDIGLYQVSVFSLAMSLGLSVACDVKWCAHNGKVFSLTWLNHIPQYGGTLLSCGPNGEMVPYN